MDGARAVARKGTTDTDRMARRTAASCCLGLVTWTANRRYEAVPRRRRWLSSRRRRRDCSAVFHQGEQGRFIEHEIHVREKFVCRVRGLGGVSSAPVKQVGADSRIRYRRRHHKSDVFEQYQCVPAPCSFFANGIDIVRCILSG